MKKHIVLFALLLLAAGAVSAQDELFEAKLTKEKVPAVVLASVEKDFPDAIITEYNALPVTILEEGWVITKDKPMDGKYDTYYLTIKGKNFDGKATYNANGELVSAQEYAKDIPLPLNVERAIGKRYPGWGISKDHMSSTFYKGDRKKTYYHVKLSKGPEYVTVVFDGHGNEVKQGRLHGKEKGREMNRDEG